MERFQYTDTDSKKIIGVMGLATVVMMGLLIFGYFNVDRFVKGAISPLARPILLVIVILLPLAFGVLCWVISRSPKIEGPIVVEDGRLRMNTMHAKKREAVDVVISGFKIVTVDDESDPKDLLRITNGQTSYSFSEGGFTDKASFERFKKMLLDAGLTA